VAPASAAAAAAPARRARLRGLACTAAVVAADKTHSVGTRDRPVQHCHTRALTQETTSPPTPACCNVMHL
jgi:hypothetical protein